MEAEIYMFVEIVCCNTPVYICSILIAICTSPTHVHPTHHTCHLFAHNSLYLLFFCFSVVHDTQSWIPICKSGMIFVPGKNEGISHNPMEYSTPEACEKVGN
eukprot:TRINITY_DN10996_c0_g1_i1.p1 TRINITY_DN10996_c0_g1~~TRINITY_DN10996_c0_g1_i1.p1  ORF type:complete len:102 (-),score=10.15 TRINITY_DN10996_c0_g1_i1:67-372(-)